MNVDPREALSFGITIFSPRGVSEVGSLSQRLDELISRATRSSTFPRGWWRMLAKLVWKQVFPLRSRARFPSALPMPPCRLSMPSHFLQLFQTRKEPWFVRERGGHVVHHRCSGTYCPEEGLSFAWWVLLIQLRPGQEARFPPLRGRPLARLFPPWNLPQDRFSQEWWMVRGGNGWRCWIGRG